MTCAMAAAFGNSSTTEAGSIRYARSFWHVSRPMPKRRRSARDAGWGTMVRGEVSGSAMRSSLDADRYGAARVDDGDTSSARKP